MNFKKYELTFDQVRKTCDNINLSSSKSTKNLEQIVGQEKAVRSLEFGLQIDSPGYNIYISGEEGTGKKTLIRSMLNTQAKEKQSPNDQIAVYNFHDNKNPIILELKSGNARKFKKDLENMIKILDNEVPKLFSKPENATLIEAIKEISYKEESKIKKVYNQRLAEFGYALAIGKGSVGLNPIKHDHESIIDFSRREKVIYNSLSTEVEKLGLILIQDGLDYYVEKNDPNATDEDLQKGQDLLNKYQESAEELAKQFINTSIDKEESKEDFLLAKKVVREYIQTQTGLIKKYKQKILEARKLIANRFVLKLITNIAEKYKNSQLVDYLVDLQEDLIKYFDYFSLKETEKALAQGFADRYQINILVDNTYTKGAPVIFETNPTHDNLFGNVERIISLKSDNQNSHLKITAGSFSKANNGYLVIDAWKALQNRGVWEGIVRALENKKVQITDGNEFYSSTIKTNDSNADVKLVLVGGRNLKYLMQHYLPEFDHLFKVKADFSSEMNYSKDNVEKYASFINDLCEKESLLNLDLGGVKSVVEYGMRLVNNQKKQSANFGKIADIIREADYWARQDNEKTITEDYIEKAQSEKILRSKIIEEKIHEYINEEIIKIKTKGEQIGQINGLAVYSYPDHPFGIPTRITAVTSVGKKGLINIEEKCELSGEILNKSAEIIYRGILKGRFAQDKNISLDATICFEQTYGGVDGDSASIATLCAVYSHLCQTPINQQLAVTGSLDQFGNAQAIGGVNEKIEGFYYTCKDKGLTGEQGVVIPKDNINDLMLNKEVTTAVKEGKFHIYAVENIDQAAEVLMNTDSKQIYKNINHRLIELSDYHKDKEDK